MNSHDVPAKAAPKTRRLGPLFVGYSWATDGGWDWTSESGDRHRDVFALVIVRRDGELPLLRLTVGPAFVGILAPGLR